jgi:uncharacterized membrane protein
VSAADTGVRHDTRVPRIAWLTVVVICLIATVLLLVSQYYGYAGVLAAIGLSAAINVR